MHFFIFCSIVETDNLIEKEVIRMNRVKKAFSNRWLILLTVSLLFWAKTILAYYVDFSLGVEGSIQTFILWINPIATTLLLFGVVFNGSVKYLDLILECDFLS